jgi:hypothetical protein
MSQKFDDFLKDLEKAPQPVAAPEAAEEAPPEAPVGPPDPLAAYIGHAGPIQEKSPFDAFLEAATEGVEAEEKDPDYVQHEWKTIREAIYEDDQHIWRCERCFRQLNANRDETLNQALARYNINESCGNQIATDVMES